MVEFAIPILQNCCHNVLQAYFETVNLLTGRAYVAAVHPANQPLLCVKPQERLVGVTK